MNLGKIIIDDKLKGSIENWLNAGYGVTLVNHEPDHEGVAWTEIVLDLMDAEADLCDRTSVYWYSHKTGDIEHFESSSTKAYHDTLKLVGEERENRAGILRAMDVLRYMMDLVEDVVDDFLERGRGSSAILGAQVINGLVFETYSELLEELDEGWEPLVSDYEEWWNDDEWWEDNLNRIEKGE